MFKKLILCVLGIAVLLPAAVTVANAKKLEAVIFTAPYCGHCQRLKKEFMQDFKQQFKDTVTFIEYDITQEGNNIVFNDTMAEYKADYQGVPAAIIGNTLLMGYPDQIKTQGPDAVKKALASNERTFYGTKEAIANAKANPEQYTAKAATTKDAKSMFEQITFWAIISAGLIDGINPCAFAVIVFFISFLTVYKYDKKEVILVGASYCTAVFIAYVLIGLGLLNFVYAMSSFYYVMMGFKYLTIGLCAIFLLLSLYDFIIYQITKNHNKVILQLPKSYKEYIHKVMRFFLKEKHSSKIRLVAAALCVGFIVSLVEAVCTGQVYLPTIALILKDANEHFMRAITYLLIYNLMFIVPLVIIFILSLMGYESKGFNEFLKKHLGLTKLLLCLLFLGLLLLLVFNM